MESTSLYRTLVENEYITAPCVPAEPTGETVFFSYAHKYSIISQKKLEIVRKKLYTDRGSDFDGRKLYETSACLRGKPGVSG